MRREPKLTKSYQKALLIDAMGGGLCPTHGEYLGHGKYGKRDCPFCDIEENFRKKASPNGEPLSFPQQAEGYPAEEK